MAEGPDWATIVAAIAAAFAAAAALAVPITTFWRRPRLAIEEDVGKIHGRVEGNGLPYVGLLVSNRERRRAAHGTRVLVHHYREQRIGSPAVTMGSPLLGWPSAVAETGGTVVFAGDARPLDFGVLVAAWRGSLDELVTDTGGQMAPDEIIAKRGHWELKLALAFDLAIADQREWLPPRQDGYVVRLVVGADDGAARTYDVDIGWDGTAPGAAAALASVEIAVREVRSGSS